jgi:hypothetical protein
VHDGDCAIRDPLHVLFFQFSMCRSPLVVMLWHHLTHASLLIERCGRVGVVDGVAKVGQAGDHVSGVDCEA